MPSTLANVSETKTGWSIDLHMAAIRLASLTARPGNSVGQETRLHFRLSGGGAAGSLLSATGGRTGFHSIGCIHEAVLFGVSALDQTRVHKQRPEAHSLRQYLGFIWCTFYS